MSLRHKRKGKGKMPKRVAANANIDRALSDMVLESLTKKQQEGISPHEFHIGMNIELEHHNLTKGDLKDTAKITLAHLKEHPDYNTRLKKMEKEAEASDKKRKLKKSSFLPSAEPKKTYEEKVEDYLEGFEPVEEIEGQEEYED